MIKNDFFKNIKILDGGMGQELLAKGLKSKGTLWSASSLIEEKYHNLVINIHENFIKAGADVILTNTFTTRKVRLKENKVLNKFKYVNEKACELALKAIENINKNTILAGCLPAQNNTYVKDERDKEIIESNFYDQAKLIAPYVNFFYLDVLSSSRELEISMNICEKLKKPVLVGLHLKKNGKLSSGENLLETINKYNNKNWLGLVIACTSMDIVRIASKELSNTGINYGFKVNLWGLDEPLPVKDFNDAKFDEEGINPNLRLGKKNISEREFKNFIKDMVDEGATIIGGCCETTPLHIKWMYDQINQ